MNFLGFRTTENEIYVKFCLRKSLVARDSIVDILGIKAGRFLRVFSKEAPGKLKNTNRCFSRYLPSTERTWLGIWNTGVKRKLFWIMK